MDFSFTPEQDELRATVRRFFARDDAPLWTQLTGQLGVTALAIPEEYGGFGASLVEVAVVLEEAGAVLLAEPYLSTVVTAAALGTAGASLLPGIADGTSVATLGLAEPRTGFDLARMSCVARRAGDGYAVDGVKEFVFDGLRADVVVVAAYAEDGPGLFAVRVGDAGRTGHPTLDQTRPQARFTFTATPAVRVGGVEATGRALDLLWAAIAIESVGVARASLAMTVEHLQTRQQFGVPLATFQALRHRIADLAVAIEAAASCAWYAIRVAGTDEFAVAAPMAKLVAADAAYQVTAQGIQLHGGIGITWEHDAHRYFKRATANRLLLGDPVVLRRILGTRAQIGLTTSE